MSGDLRTKTIFAVLSLCKSELSELFLNQLSILFQNPIFKELTELLKLSDIRQLELGKLMFCLNHSLLPSKFNYYFSLNKQVHSYATRYATDFHLPFCRTNLRKFSVSFQGPTYYNSIENDIKESNSLHLFKTKLKKEITYELLVINLVVNSYLSSHVWYCFYTYCYMYLLYILSTQSM